MWWIAISLIEWVIRAWGSNARDEWVAGWGLGVSEDEGRVNKWLLIGNAYNEVPALGVDRCIWVDCIFYWCIVWAISGRAQRSDSKILGRIGWILGLD